MSRLSGCFLWIVWILWRPQQHRHALPASPLRRFPEPPRNHPGTGGTWENTGTGCRLPRSGNPSKDDGPPMWSLPPRTTAA